MALILDAKNRQPIKGMIKADVRIIRTVSGLLLPVSCLLHEGTYIGSCVYSDLCFFIKYIFKFDQTNCPQNLIDNGFNCTCPFDFPITELNINHTLLLPSAAGTLASFLASGDFDVTIKGTIDTTNILCLNMKFAMKPV